MKEVMITLGGNYVSEVNRLVEAMKKDGLRVKQVYRPMGVISGSADDSTINRLRMHKEVVSLKEQKTIQIAPPYKAVQ